MKRILVFGSLNIDLVQRVPRLPRAGETLQGSSVETYIGGKGANQACAATKLSGNVQMLGKVGSDVFAPRIMRELETAGVRTELIRVSKEPCGTAVIFVLPNGDNTIVISAGANADIPATFAHDVLEKMQPGDLLLCQLETPIEAVSSALQLAHAKGLITILDPAPAQQLPEELLSCVTILTPNQTETAILLADSEVPENFTTASSAARALQDRGARSVVIKMGALGCLVAHGGDFSFHEGHKVKVIDTTSAGDTFNGGLAAALARGDTLLEAARFANAAAALSVTRSGAIPSIPDFQSVRSFLAARPV